MAKTKFKTVVSHKDGSILIETIYDKGKQQTNLAICTGSKIEIQKTYKTNNELEIKPYRSDHAFLINDVLLLSQEPVNYGSVDKLKKTIQVYIHKYMDMDSAFEIIATHYVLLTWLYDAHNCLGYLRIKGDFGAGKTLFLQVISSICYKPLFASGAATVAPLFHLLDDIGGTLVMDESDFYQSSEKSLIAKILNNGNAKGFPVLRCEKTKNETFTTRSFNVYGPKILASRGRFDDDALESRFFTFEAGLQPLRKDIPLKLGQEKTDEALVLRNKLLQFRFDHFHKEAQSVVPNQKLSPRSEQVLSPLLTFMNKSEMKIVIDWMQSKERQAQHERGMELVSHVLQSVHALLSNRRFVQVGQIREHVMNTYGDYYEHPLTSHAVGRVVRNSLHLRTQLKNGRYCVSDSEKEKIKLLVKRYGLE